MDVELLARIQFALTIGFHFLYPPISIGLGVVLVMMEGLYLKTKDPIYKQMTKYWAKIFGLVFAMGVSTGIVMEFEFGTNWSRYSRFVGDVFGSPLAAEGVFAFFLESGFLAIVLFGWNKVSEKMHFFATCMVSLGSMLSAVWIIVANSWMQTPTGYKVVTTNGFLRAEITDFWAMVLNPSTFDRLSHTLSASFITGALFVVSISAYYLIKNRHVDFAKKSLKIAITFAFVATLLQLATGHSSAIGVAKYQPAKLAAMEAHYDSLAPGTLYLFGWVNDNEQKVEFGIGIPKMLSFLVHFDPNKPVKGLNAFKKEDRPPIQIVFQAYHIMIAIGMFLIGLTLVATYLSWKDQITKYPIILTALLYSAILPQIANQVGWITAEVGRQPWIVYNLLRTKDGLSKVVDGGQIVFSLILFTAIYILLLGSFIYILNKKVQHGPEQA